jgi:hypothetical protein
MTIHALLRALHPGRVVPLLIELRRKFKHILGAKFDAVATSLTAVFQDMDFTTRYLDLFYIKWNPPECHDPSLGLGEKALLLIPRSWNYIPASEHVKIKSLSGP